ncbi:MAG: phenylalanine--tRNA ligase subunit beta [Patescibacteria group bacterium]
MRFSYDWIKELSASALTAQQAAELLTAKAFEVNEVSGSVLDIDILPNRPDCLSHLGVARELAVLTNQRFTAPAYEWSVSEQPSKEVAIEDAEACPRYSGLVVKGLKVGPSPAWLRERIAQCGLQSINNVVDVTNYVMLELGQPMHAFDLNLIDRIVVRHAKPGETLQALPTGRQALDEARIIYKLDESMLVIADGSKAVAIAGIKGGAGTGISDATTEILLEAANFSPQSIRATSRALDLRTDASVRFCYGVDPNLTAPALMRTAELLAKVAGGSVERGVIDVYPVVSEPREVMFDCAYACSLLGIDIGEPQIRGILQSLGFEVSNHDGRMKVLVPTRRSDVTGAEDLIEEIGRVYGYDAISSLAPVMPVFDEHSWVREDEAVAWDEYAFIRERGAIGRILAGAGYSEVFNYVFLSDELKEILKLDDLHELAQPQSGDYRWLRSSLVPRLLVNARDNLRFTDRVHLFETGHVFDRIGQGKESNRLGLLIAAKGNDSQLFYELKGTIDLVLERLGVTDAYYDDAEPFPWDGGAINATLKGRQALIRTEKGQVLGFVGMVHGRVNDALKLKGSAAIAELDLRALVAHAQQEREFEPLPKYPSVTRDIAVMVPVDTKIDDILQVVQDADTGGLVQDVDVFDVFEPTGKEKIGKDNDKPEYGKSVAFHVILRSDERTLKDEDANVAEAAIKKALQEKLDAQIR